MGGGRCVPWLGPALVLLAVLVGPGAALQNVTAQLFGAEAHGTLAAFGDFNSDKQTDLFVLRGGERGAGVGRGCPGVAGAGAGLGAGGRVLGQGSQQPGPVPVSERAAVGPCLGRSVVLLEVMVLTSRAAFGAEIGVCVAPEVFPTWRNRFAVCTGAGLYLGEEVFTFIVGFVV